MKKKISIKTSVVSILFIVFTIFIFATFTFSCLEKYSADAATASLPTISIDWESSTVNLKATAKLSSITYVTNNGVNYASSVDATLNVSATSRANRFRVWATLAIYDATTNTNYTYGSNTTPFLGDSVNSGATYQGSGDGDTIAYNMTAARGFAFVEGHSYTITVYIWAHKGTNYNKKHDVINSQFSFCYDTKSPTLNSTVAMNSYNKSAFTVSVNDSYPYQIQYKEPGASNFSTLTATSITIGSGSYNKNGLWEFKGVDRYGRISEDSFKAYYDNVAPTISLSGVMAGGYTKSSVTVTYSDTFLSTYKYRYNDGSEVSFSSGKGFSSDGKYSITVTDKAGNSSSTSFTIDSTAPSVSLSGATNGGYTKSSVTVTYSDANVKTNTYTLNGGTATSFSSGKVFSSDGVYKITIKDQSGNTTERSFIIDKTAPSVSLSGAFDAGYTKSNVAVTYSDTNLSSYTYKFNNGVATSFSSGTSFNDEGAYTITIIDKAGNSTSKTFTIDRTAPVLTMKTDADVIFVDGSYVNRNVYFVGSDVSLNSINIFKKNSNGGYEALDFWQDYQNRTIYYDSRESLETYNRFYTTSDARAYIAAKEEELIESKTNWTTNVVGTIIESESAYAKTGVDYYMYEGYIFFDLTRLETFIYENSAKFLASSNNNIFFEVGSFKVVAVDKSGNETVRYFLIDKTAPSVSLSGVTNGYTNKDFSFIASDSVYFGHIEYKKPNATTWTTVADDSITISKNEGEGTYQFIAYDFAGNASAIISVVLDTIAPSFTLNEFYKESETVTLSVVESNTYTITFDGKVTTDKSWTAKNLDERTYILTVSDKAGNSTSKSFIVDKTAPSFTLNEFYKSGQVVESTVVEQYYSNATLDGKALSVIANAVNIPITDSLTDGNHTIVIFDKAGNSTSKFFTVDKTAPVFNVNAFYRAGQTVSVSITESNLAGIALNGVMQDVNKRKWDVDSELTEKEYTIVITDKAGNSTSKNFIVDLTTPAFNVNAFYSGSDTVEILVVENNLDYVTFNGAVTAERSWQTQDLDEKNHTIVAYDKAGNSTSKSFVVDKTAPKFSVNAYYKAGQTVSITVVDSNLDYVTFDRETTLLRSWSTDALGGSHTIVAYDKAGNSTAQTFIVDKTVPQFEVKEYYKAEQTIDIALLEDNFSSLTLKKNNVTVYSGAERTWNSDELDNGTYILTVEDLAGNSTAKSFIIDKIAPVFSVSSFYRAGQTIAINLIEDNLNVITISGKGITQEKEFNSNDFEDGTYILTVSDKAGNSTAKSFTIDKTAPSFSLNSYYNAEQSILLNIVESNLNSITLDGNACETEIVVAELEDGTHTIKVLDKAGNSTSKSFIVDKTAPVFTLKDFYAANETISLVLEESNLDRVTLDGAVTAERSWNADNLAEGEHIIVIFDKAGNSTSKTFFFKTAAPLLTLRKNGAAVSSGAYLDANDIAELVINDEQFDYMNFDGARVTDLVSIGSCNWTKEWYASELAEGTHTVTIFDKAKNETSIIFTVDRTAPALTVRVNGSIVMEPASLKATDSISFVFSDVNLDYASLDGEITVTTQYSVAALAEFVHEFTVYDKAGNEATFSFTVDKTAPKVSLNEYYNGSAIIDLTITEIYLDYVTLDGSLIENFSINGSDIAEGTHTVVAVDKAGNAMTTSFIVDKTAPNFTLEEFYNAQDIIMLSIVEKNLDYVTLDGGVTNVTNWQGSNLPNGSHTIVAYDNAGNSTAQTFFVDKTSPVLTGNLNGGAFISGSFISSSDTLTFTVSEENLKEILLNGESVDLTLLNVELLEEKTHILVVTDLAGNMASAEFTIDNTAPNFTLKEFYNANDIILLSIVEKNLDRVTLDGGVTTITSWQGSALPEGTHTVVAYDKAGNVAEKSFIIDKTAPIINILKDGVAVVEESVFVSQTNVISFDIFEINLESISLGDTITQESIFEAVAFVDGTYILTAKDKAGNSTAKSFIVDKTAPSLTLRKNGAQVEDMTYFKENDTLSIVRNDVNLLYVLLDDVITENTSWKVGELYEGTHSIEVFDKAGNALAMSFVVDKTAPSFTLNEFYKSGQTVNYEVLENNFAYVTLFESSTQYYEGEKCGFNVDELSESTYTLTVYDKAGNITSQSFIVDKTAPMITVGEFFKSADTIKISISEKALNYFTVDEEITSITQFSAQGFADGIHTVIAYDKAGNVTEKSFIVDKTAPVLLLAEYYNSTQTVYFDIIEENLLSVVLDGNDTNETEFAVSEIAEGVHNVVITDKAGNVKKVSFIVDKTAPSFTLKEYYKETETLYLGISESNLDYVMLDDMITEVSVYQCTQLSEGKHTVVVYDKAGNVTEKSFIVDKTAPVISVAHQDGTIVDSVYFSAQDILKIDINEINLKYVTLNGLEITDFTILCAEKYDGEYTIKAVDMAGNSAMWTFTIDKTAPIITLRRNMSAIAQSGVYISSFDTVSVLVSDKNLDRVEFDGLTTIVYSWTASSLADGTHTVIAYDLAGNMTTVSFIVHKAAPKFELKEYYISGEIITLDLSEESIDYVLLDNETTFQRSWLANSLAEGIHRIKAVDKAGNETEKLFTVDTLKPTLELMKNSQVVANGVFANSNDEISINVADVNLDYVTIDGEKTTLRVWTSSILDEREHIIVAVDKAGNSTSVSFIIDKTMPECELQQYYIEGENILLEVKEINLDSIYLNGKKVFNYAFDSSTLGEGTYVLTIHDKAGNVMEKSFIVDLSAPVLSIIGFNAEGEPISMLEGNSYGALEIVASDIAPYSIYAKFNDGAFANCGQAYNVSALVENQGTWSFYAEDINGHVSETIIVTVDFTVPIISTAFVDAEQEKGYTSSTFSVEVIDTFGKELYAKHESHANFFLCSNLNYTVLGTYENQGAWTFYAVDAHGLVSAERTIILDISAPIITKNGLVTEEASVAYTNTSFTYSAEDYHFSAIKYRKSGGEYIVSEETSVNIENTKENEGTWEFYAEDRFGQKSATYSIVLNTIFDFKNIENIRNSFKKNTWYTVTLPAKIYANTLKPDISGVYTFADYETAMQFGIAKEKEYRVYSVVEGGFGYVSVSNENVYINYASEGELDAALRHYAGKYISTQKQFSYVESRNVYENITNEGFISDVSALTNNTVTVPDFLKEYNLPIYLARQSFVPTNNQALAPSMITLTYLGNLTGATVKHSFELVYGESFSAAMSRASNLYEGYYLYEESDKAGNFQKAILFIDLSLPSISAEIERGDGTETVTITKDTVGERSGVFYALSFSIQNLLDNIDAEYVSIAISSDKYSGIFHAGMDVPVLDATLGSGKYTVTVYDRSYNLLTFSVVIAGTAPSWYYTSLSSTNKKLSIYINKNDNYNAIISLSLVKIRSDGTKILLEADDERTPITPATLTYVFTTGGKYGLTILDTYGRETTMEPIFFEKGLPYGALNGVNNGKTTRTEVSFTYGATYGLKAYYVNGSTKTPISGLTPEYDAQAQSYTVRFEGTEGMTVDYFLLLYLLSDEGIFIEYSFTIDKESPLYSITDIEGGAIDKNGSTNKPFIVEWGEQNVTAKYARQGYSAQNYISGTPLHENTLYTFTLTDRVGNSSSFTVYLDSEVSFAFSNDYLTLDDGTFLSNKEQIITVTEETTSFVLVDADGNTYAQGEKLNKDGTYILTAEDVYGNALTLVLCLDFTAPILEIDSINEVFLSNKDVIVTCQETDARIDELESNGSIKETVQSGKKFTEEGTYRLRVSDKAGNFTDYMFGIDKKVAFSFTLENGYITTTNVSFVFSEEVSQSVTLDGKEVASSNRYSLPGEYVVVITDLAGNAVTATFKILPSRVKTLVYDVAEGGLATATKDGVNVLESVQSLTLTESGTYEITLYSVLSAKSYYFKITVDNTPPTIEVQPKNGGYTFANASKKDLTMVLYKDGEVVEGFTGADVTERGEYKLVLTDDVGNVKEYTFTVKYALNTFSIILIAVVSVVLIVVIVLAIRGRRIKAA